MAEHLFLDSSSITGILDRVEQKALIQRKAMPRDRRALQVILTDKGRALEKPVNQAILNANKKVLAKFEEQDTENLRKYLHILNDNS